MALSQALRAKKKGYSIAEYSVFIIVIGVLCAAVIPIFIRINAYKRNTIRIADMSTISQEVKAYYVKNNHYPASLRELERGGVGAVPKDPAGVAYCSGAPEYQTGDYQYFACTDCEAVGPLKTYLMRNIVQVGALMEWENKRGERNSGNRWAKYKEGETSNCAANAVWGAGTLIEGVKGNRVGGTGSNVINFLTIASQPEYDPRYNMIITYERK